MTKVDVVLWCMVVVLVLVLALLPATAEARSCPTNYPKRIDNGCMSPTGGVSCDPGYYGGHFRKQASGLWFGKCLPLKIVRG